VEIGKFKVKFKLTSKQMVLVYRTFTILQRPTV